MWFVVICMLQGLFEILTLSGSHVLNSTSGPQQRQNGTLSVSLAKPDGRVFGGGVVGSMIAAGPIQIVVGSFKQDISSQLRRLSGESAVANVLASPDLVRVPVMMAPTNVDERNLTSAFLESAHGGAAGNSIAANQHMSHTSLLNLGQNAFQAMSDQRTPPDSKSNFVHL
ncbi:hypothetical protein L484_014107 [Morus notabilis]|uniref:AT-hook motif nuclear-localized protein n=1 Tax=Morus notabilis TaxID=981085 RepID=W9RBZ4_9ROSA|nr:AT-hook motif nuclear-localized protein 10 [Morus notabilis]EXB81623.1 hypothetical protein L484_014107 [Morus notabilis]